MKNGLLFILLLISFAGFAQKNSVNVGLMGLGAGDISLGYERAITPSGSINLNVGYWDLNYSPVDIAGYSDYGKGVWLKELENGFHTSLEYRFYMGKKEAIQGFYVAPYLRYWSYSMVLNDIIDNSNVDNVLFDLNTKVSSFGLGFQTGYHWLIKNRFSIDWYFVGLGVERMNINAAYVTSNSASFNYSYIERDVRDVFSGVKLLQNGLKTEVKPDALSVKLPFWAPGIKSGLSIGWAF